MAVVPWHRFWQNLSQFFWEQFLLLLFFLLVFGMGIVYGTGLFQPLPFSRGLLLVENQGRLFFPVQSGRSISFFQEIFYQQQFSLWLLFLLGLSGMGVLLLPLFIFLRGVVLGLTVAFLLAEFSTTGVLFTLFLVVPHHLIILPTILFAAVSGVVFSLGLFKQVLGPERLFPLPGLRDYMFIYLLLAVLLFFASLVEAWVIPVLFRLLLFFFC